MERRKFFELLRNSLLLGFGGGFLTSKKAFSQSGICTTIADVKASDNAVLLEDGCIHLYCGGFWGGNRTHVALFIDKPAEITSYIDRVVIASESKETLAVRYLRQNQTPLPYLIFDSLNLAGDTLFFILIREQIPGQDAKVYRYPLTKDKIQFAQLNPKHLPPTLTSLLQKNFKMQVSTPLHFTANLGMDTQCDTEHKMNASCWQLHTIQAQLLARDASNEFLLRCSFVHPDVSPDHYMRYFWVTDPVGRILGYYERGFNESPRNQVTLKNLTDQQRVQFEIPTISSAQINACPYLMVFATDQKDALTQTILWISY